MMKPGEYEMPNMVLLAPFEYKWHTYYVVTTPVYGSVSKPNDRRHHARVEIGMSGTLIFLWL